MRVIARRAPRLPEVERVDIGYSLLAVAFASAFYLLMLGQCLFWIMGLFSRHPIGIAVGIGAIVGLPLLLAFLPAMLHAWTHKGPVLSMDSEGVTDVRKKSSHIPWSIIGMVNLGVGERASYLCFGFRHADRQRQDAPLLGPIGVLLNRLYGLSDWNVSLRLLACKKREVLRMAEAFRQQSLRKRVVEINRKLVPASDPNQGWSGRL